MSSSGFIVPRSPVLPVVNQSQTKYSATLQCRKLVYHRAFVGDHTLARPYLYHNPCVGDHPPSPALTQAVRVLCLRCAFVKWSFSCQLKLQETSRTSAAPDLLSRNYSKIGQHLSHLTRKRPGGGGIFSDAGRTTGDVSEG